MVNIKFLFSLTFLSILFFSPAGAKENKLIVYTYDSFTSEWGPGPKIEKSFEKFCNCDLIFIGMDSSVGILGRLKLEGKSSPADIILGLDTNLVSTAENSNLLVHHEVDFSNLSLPINWENEIFVPFDWGHFAFIYDETKLKNPPRSFDDLIARDNNFRIIIQDPRTSTSGLGLLMWIRKIYGEKASEIWKKLSPKIVTVTKGWSESYGMFLEGESDLVLSYTTSPAYHIIAEGENKYKAAIFDEGHYLQIELAAMTKNSSNPKLAKQFLDFILNDEFQKIIPTTNWMFPVINVDIHETFNMINQPENVLLFPSKVAGNFRSAWINEWLIALTE